MTPKKAIEKGYTHKGFMFDDIPVFVRFNDDEDESFEAVGVNWFYDKYLALLSWLDFSDKQFEIWIDQEL